MDKMSSMTLSIWKFLFDDIGCTLCSLSRIDKKLFKKTETFRLFETK